MILKHKLRIEGKYEDWMNDKIKENKLSWIKDQKQSIIRMDETTRHLRLFNQTSPDGYLIRKRKME